MYWRKVWLGILGSGYRQSAPGVTLGRFPHLPHRASSSAGRRVLQGGASSSDEFFKRRVLHPERVLRRRERVLQCPSPPQVLVSCRLRRPESRRLACAVSLGTSASKQPSSHQPTVSHPCLSSAVFGDSGSPFVSSAVFGDSGSPVSLARCLGTFVPKGTQAG